MSQLLVLFAITTIIAMTVGCASLSDCGCPFAGGGKEPALPVADLNGVAGKVFDLNQDTGHFRFLKQDVPVDTETGPGQAWFAGHMTSETTFLEKDERRNLRGLTEPIIVIFTGFDEENAKALKEGNTFRADHMVLRPDLKEATGISVDGQTYVTWFTPRVANFSRDGIVKIGDKEVSAGVKRGGIRITIEQVRSAADMKDGNWRVTPTGKLEDGKFVVSEMLLQALPDEVADDDPKLPRVLSVGDSISMNYEKGARDGVKDIANYHRITDNSWSTARCVTFIRYWMGDYTKKGRQWDLILFNSGMHDMKQKELRGAYAMPLDQYKKNMRIWIEQMKPTGAKLMYVTTTPVQNDSGSARYAFRSKGAEDDFNKAAREVLADYPEILICDLAAFVDNSPEFDNWRKGRDVHYWKAEEQALIGEAVAACVKKALKSQQ